MNQLLVSGPAGFQFGRLSLLSLHFIYVPLHFSGLSSPNSQGCQMMSQTSRMLSKGPCPGLEMTLA
uniref:Auxin response factor n=1 Tax=Rhizophora mucronata TaxID=61149 RepID=A0A2P2PRZ7_RHIMU